MHGIFYICHENTSAAVIDFTRPTTTTLGLGCKAQYLTRRLASSCSGNA